MRIRKAYLRAVEKGKRDSEVVVKQVPKLFQEMKKKFFTVARVPRAVFCVCSELEPCQVYTICLHLWIAR